MSVPVEQVIPVLRVSDAKASIDWAKASIDWYAKLGFDAGARSVVYLRLTDLDRWVVFVPVTAPAAVRRAGRAQLTPHRAPDSGPAPGPARARPSGPTKRQRPGPPTRRHPR